VTSPAQAVTSAEWWRQAVVYEICPHRYGDLPGIASRIPYLASLGIDAVCLSPFQARGGFRELTSRLHPYGIEVIVEFGPDYARFDVLEADWNAEEFLQVVTDSLADAQQNGASTTWLLSGHDAGPGRVRAATLLMLALPGSAYMGQGEELGLHEVAEAADIPAGLIEAQEHDPASALGLFRQALGWRRRLQSAGHLEWMPGTNGQVLHFRRPGGWRSVTNFGPGAVALPPGTVAVASAPLEGGLLPADTTAWIISRAGPRR
jgi:glycosidase